MSFIYASCTAFTFLYTQNLHPASIFQKKVRNFSPTLVSIGNILPFLKDFYKFSKMLSAYAISSYKKVSKICKISSVLLLTTE